MAVTAVEQSRPTLGGFMSLTCFQYLRLGAEEVADRAPIVAAGRQRGYELVKELGLLGTTADSDTIKQRLDATLGKDGTRLCQIQSISSLGDGTYEVRLTEAACTAGQQSSSPLCAFTLGVFIGAIHGLTGTRMRGTELECCACGAPECVYRISPV